MTPAANAAVKERFALEKELLESGRFFKLICGAGNEDPGEIRKLCLVYSLAGAAGIDLAARENIVRAALEGIAEAERLAPESGAPGRIRPFLTVSVGMRGDPHVRKARIVAQMCTECGLCVETCPNDAISESFAVERARCIGCGACADVCPVDAVGFAHQEIEAAKTLKACVDAGAENIELHAAVGDHEQALREWELITELLPDSFVSVCLDRGHLSNRQLRKRIEMLKERAEGRMIVQADGIPMSGSKDDFNTTLQAVATADIVAKMGLGVPVLLSGGTNSKTVELARLAGVPFAGVSLGTYARRLISAEIKDPAFPDAKILKAAVAKARSLVETCGA